MSSSPSQRSAFGEQLFDGLGALPGSQRFTADQLEVIYALAYAHVTQRQYAQALPMFAFLSQYGPTRKHYLAGLALCLQMQARYDEAIRIYSLIGTLFPVTPEAVLRVAECQLALADVPAAQASLRMVAEYAQADAAHAALGERARSLLALTEKEARP
ncbi:SycD/LcrH family type III secretion system chaperone [Achromobacter sp. Bel]|uniref:SycD/LcrH family type III secretion system chaperone n=1 Tax=Achromobacter sp. Bel TaxID=2727415 RepID=UPI00145F14C4|nr:SycD/LcrH family type III secretion system chaperone [Achromobacter sp. Bel]NMK47572.1 SycD/LcrH family type III secretion system chaperone [Achromobacter sp. Bel]